jgi:hypothetical protein
MKEDFSMNDFEKQLSTALFRMTCPEATELGEYQLGMSAGAPRRAIRDHLKECPHCQQELVQLQTYLDEVQRDLSHSPAERLQIWIARLMPSLGGPTLSPAFAVRGESGKVLAYQAGPAQLTLEVQKDLQQLERTLLGLLIGIDPDNVQAQLWHGGELTETADVDELGNFTLANVSPGTYELILAGPSLEIHIEELQL